jgi:hypothetical protein
MNEKLISDLVVEAQQYMTGSGSREFVQKFTELIVKECGVALNPMLRDMISRGEAFDLVKQHFGVEE